MAPDPNKDPDPYDDDAERTCSTPEGFTNLVLQHIEPHVTSTVEVAGYSFELDARQDTAMQLIGKLAEIIRDQEERIDELIQLNGLTSTK